MSKKVIFILSIIILIFSLTYYYINYMHTNNLYIKQNVVQDSIGVNIHFINPNLNETKKIYNAGFKTVRMDFNWAQIEKSRGVYDFSQYDKLVKELDKNKTNIIFILDYGNVLYDKGLAPYSKEGREAFANFARQAVKRYKGKPIMWEIWNEPNNSRFWKPMPNIENYYKLAINTINAIKSVDKSAFIIAPAQAGVNYSDLNYLGEKQFYKYIDAVSVHPYRQAYPETVIWDYKKISNLIEQYPHKEGIKLFCGEWGYSTTWKDTDEIVQAQYCVREYLTNLMCGIGLTIWYDWKNDGVDPKNAEQNFGTVYNNLQPKMTYYAITTLTSVLNNYKFVKRIYNVQDSDYILMFKNGNKITYALWTTNDAHEIQIKLHSNNIKVVELMGNSYSRRDNADVYNINVSKSVIYITDLD